MSLKQIKKVLESQKKLQNEEEEVEDEQEEDEEEEVIKPKTKKATNAFALLDLEDNDMVAQSDSDDDSTINVAKPSRKKKKNKKGKGKGKGKQEEKKHIPKEEEDIDQIINELDGQIGTKEGGESGNISNGKVSDNGNSNVMERERMLKVDPRNLDPDAEIRRVFGSQVLGNTPKPNQPRSKKFQHKKTNLVKAKDEWAPMFPGISMELLPARPGSGPNVNYFKIVWSSSYHELQQHFYECVETADPYSFQDLLMIHPYHVDSNLQLAQVCIQTGDYAMAGDLVERCLYAFECAWHPRFAPHGAANCYLEFNVPENRSFFLAILKHIQLLGRRGSTRTALEFAKLLLALDPTDPLYMRAVLDYYCLRGKEFSFLLSLFERAQVDNTPFSMCPNFCYSAALAKLTLELQKGKSSSSSSSSTDQSTTSAAQLDGAPQNVANNPYPLASSKYLLYIALTLFPTVLLPLLNKAGVSYKDVLPDETTSFFNNSDTSVPPLLQKMINLFVDKNNTLWKAPEVVTWIKEVITEVQRQASSSTKRSTEMKSNRDWMLTWWTTRSEAVGSVPLLLSEHADTASPLPPELFAPHAQNNGHNNVPRPAPLPPLAQNPIALFLQTLMPWVQVPPPE